MTGAPALTPTPTDPGGIQARADGQLIEVRTYEGELIRTVTPMLAKAMVQSGLSDPMKHCLRLKPGIRWLPPRFDRPSGRPDLDAMRWKEPARYEAVWKGNREAHTGRGALGRSKPDDSIIFGQ